MEGIYRNERNGFLYFSFFFLVGYGKAPQSKTGGIRKKIFELAQTEKIELLLLSVPYIDYPNDHPYYNALWRIAAEYDIDGLNFNHPSLRSLMNDSYDFADAQHLNIRGSEIFSRRLGYELKKRFELPDRRSDPHYTSYDVCLTVWEQRKNVAK